MISVTQENLRIGAKVVRGKDWKYNNQDRGEVGIIRSLSSTAGWVNVDGKNGWDNNYRIGAEGKYDLYYFEETIIFNYLIF